jgi:hypothetical protein
MDTIAAKADILRSRHWVFDLDGTLTVAIHDFASIREVLEVPPGVDILEHLDALPAAQALVMKGRLVAIAFRAWCTLRGADPQHAGQRTADS